MILSFDIGGTKILSALVEGVNIVDRQEIASPIHSNINNLVPTLIARSKECVSEADQIAIAVTGQVTAGSVNFLSTGLKRPIELVTELQDALDTRVTVLNDAAAAAWGEFQSTGGSNEDSLVYLTASTGIGAGIVCNGRLLTSSTGFAAHLGHTIVPNRIPRPCICGRVNCVESIASGRAIAELAGNALGKPITTEQVVRSANSDTRCAQILDDAAMAIASLMGNLRATFDLPVVVLGGSLGLNTEFRHRVQIAIDDLPHRYHCELLKPKLERNAELVGAALYARTFSPREEQ